MKRDSNQKTEKKLRKARKHRHFHGKPETDPLLPTSRNMEQFKKTVKQQGFDQVIDLAGIIKVVNRVSL